MKFIKKCKNPIIVAGDLNARHIAWNSKKSCPRGKKLQHFATINNAVIGGPTEPTHYYNTGNDVIDAAIIKNVTTNYVVHVINELYSDHDPITKEIQINAVTTDKKKKWINWQNFQKDLNIIPHQIKNKIDIENAVINLQTEIQAKLEKHSTNVSDVVQKTVPQFIINKLKEKNKARKRYFLTLSPTDKTILNKLTNEVKYELDKYYNSK